MNSVLETRNFVSKTRNFALKMMNCAGAPPNITLRQAPFSAAAPLTIPNCGAFLKSKLCIYMPAID